MGQRLALVLACTMAMGVPARGDQKKSSKLVRSALEFFESHTDVSIDGFLGRLRPPPIDAVEHDRVVAALPVHGGIRPDAHALAKMRLAEDVLAYHGRRGVISFTIIDVPPAFVGLHARAVILVSTHALSLVNREEFAALVAHEIAHEYVWLDYQAAEQRGDHARIRELELRCDGIAVLTLRRLGVDAERLVTAVEMLTWYNEQRRLDPDRGDYVSREDRRAFIRAIAQLPWATADVRGSPATEHSGITASGTTSRVWIASSVIALEESANDDKQTQVPQKWEDATVLDVASVAMKPPHARLTRKRTRRRGVALAVSHPAAVKPRY